MENKEKASEDISKQIEKGLSLKNGGKLEEKLKFEPEIYFPINLDNVNSIIPFEHDILYSTLCQARTTRKTYNNKTVTNYITCHAIFTDYGLAINMPNNVYYPSRGASLKYYPWHIITLKNIGFEINEAIGRKSFLERVRDPLFPPYFRLERWKDSETKKEFKERKGRFFEKFQSLVMDKTNEMEIFVYNLMMDKPELRKKKNFKNYLPDVISIYVYYRALKRVKKGK